MLARSALKYVEAGQATVAHGLSETPGAPARRGRPRRDRGSRAGYTSAFTSAIGDSPDASKVSDCTETALTKSFDSAASIAQQNPQYVSQITAAAQASLLSGDHWAYIVAVLLEAALVATRFPSKEREQEMLAAYHGQDVAAENQPGSAVRR